MSLIEAHDLLNSDAHPSRTLLVTLQMSSEALWVFIAFIMSCCIHSPGFCHWDISTTHGTLRENKFNDDYVLGELHDTATVPWLQDCPRLSLIINEFFSRLAQTNIVDQERFAISPHKRNTRRQNKRIILNENRETNTPGYDVIFYDVLLKTIEKTLKKQLNVTLADVNDTNSLRLNSKRVNQIFEETEVGDCTYQILIALGYISMMLLTIDMIRVIKCREITGEFVDILSKMLNLKYDSTSLKNIKSSVFYDDISYHEINRTKSLLTNQKPKDKSILHWVFDRFVSSISFDFLLYPTSVKLRYNSFTSLIERRGQRKFFKKLARAGFRFKSASLTVICEYCKKEEFLENFNTSPESPNFHYDNCNFSRDSVQVLGEININSKDDKVTANSTPTSLMSNDSKFLKEKYASQMKTSGAKNDLNKIDFNSDYGNKNHNVKNSEKKTEYSDTEIDGKPFYVTEATDTILDVTPFYVGKVTDTKVDVTPYVGETTDHKVDVTPYVDETTDPNVDVTPYVGETTDHKVDITPYVGETTDHKMDVTPYVGETTDHKVDVTPYVDETTDPNVDVTPYVGETTDPNVDVTPFYASEGNEDETSAGAQGYPDFENEFNSFIDDFYENFSINENVEVNEVSIGEIQHFDFSYFPDFWSEIISHDETKYGSDSSTESGGSVDTFTDEVKEVITSIDETVPDYNRSRRSSSSGYSSLDSESSWCVKNSEGEYEPEPTDTHELPHAQEQLLGQERSLALELSRGHKWPLDKQAEYTATFIESDLLYQQVSFNSVSNIDQCLRNPNHLNFIPVQQLNLQSFPKKLRYPELLRMLELFALLTVKITGKIYKDDRALLVISTGMVVDCEIQAISQCGYVNIETSLHHITSDTEAQSCFVEFFLDSNLNAKKLKGESIEYVPGEEGNTKVYLKCSTFDLNFIMYVNMIQAELRNSIQVLPTTVKHVLTTKVIVVSMLHGGQKVISYGSSTVLKYLLAEYQSESNGRIQFRLEKVTDIAKGMKNKHLVRKMLMYTADTCPGSCGAPVIRFKPVTTDCSDKVTYLLDTWLHHGYHKDEDLNVSYIKECTEEDFHDWDWFQKSNTGQADPVVRSATQPATQQAYQSEIVSPSNENNEVAELYHLPPSPPPSNVTLIEHPSYPAYITFQHRLQSFINWLSNNIHTPKQLAEAGFFYAGYSDCVRCFCCGLGLRSWKPGDNIYVEHEKYRPRCLYLQQLLMSNASLRQQSVDVTRSDNSIVPSNLQCTETTNDISSDEARPRKCLETLVHSIPVPEVTATVCFVSAQQTHLTAGQCQDNVQQSRPNTSSDTATSRQDYDDSTVLSQPRETESNQNVNRDNLSFRLNLLKQENKALQTLTKCKRCQVNPINILFLPCGELYACTECADKVTHCPSCGQRILGTVQTYFS